MADNLQFGVYFDLEKGVKEALKDGDKALKRIEESLSKNPIIVKIRLDQQSRLSGQVKSESQKAASALSGLKKEMAELNREWNSLTAKERGGEAGAKLMAQYRVLSQEANGYMTTLNAAVKLEDKLARQREKSANAASNAAQKTREYSQELNNQDGYVSRLLKRMAVYAAYSGATSFLTSVRDVTAEFELQRVSLGAIIQDQQKANQLFAEIKSFALTSPLKILDLTKYTKQVAAYGFETEKLFDTTKMLADISVGLGVDFGRTVLAYSQVFTTGFLRASEARQMTEQGIPIVDKLAKKLTELNGRIYTAAEVMDMMSKRAISFELVEQVFKDMTSAGGEFYNMQVKQSQTLFGMWSKLGDAAAIMYDQIGNTSTVNAGMKATMGLLELMMRNWKTTARVLDTVSVALAVYVIGLKNAAIASSSVTTAEAARLAVEKGHLVITPKAIAAIIGKGRALDLSIRLTNLHTAAMVREATATNILTKGFWKLTAAMLANPWVAAAAVIAGVTAALFHFIGHTETAAERAEKLNNSVASLKSLTTKVEPLIDTYKDLADKTERTADEQKKLNEVAIELAQKFPAAITVIKEYGQEMGLAADEVARLYENMKRMKTEDVRQKLTENENAVNKLIQRRQQLQKYFDEGKMWSGGGGTGGGGGAMVAMSDEEKRRVTTLITDIDKQILELNESIINAKRELDELPSEETQAIEGFGAWKKKLTEFSKNVGGIKVKLFDDSTIDQFGSLEEALDAAAKKYNKATESVEKYNKTLERGVAGLGQEQFDKIAAERDKAQAMKELSEEALNYYNAMALLLKVMGGSRSEQSDPRLQILNEMVQLAEKLNKEYSDWEKKVGSTQALEKVNETYAETVKYAEQVAKDAGIKLPHLETPTNAKELNEYLEAVRKVMETAKGLKGGKKAAIELAVKISNNVSAEDQKAIEQQLKQLADRISRTKTAKEFYEKILGQTGDKDMAARLATSIFGENGEELNREIADQMRKMVEGTSAVLPDMVFHADMSVNAKALRSWVDANKDALGDVAKDLTKFADESEKDTAKMVEGWLKATEKAKSASDKLLDLARTTRTEIDRIESERSKGDITDEYAKAQTEAYRQKLAQEAAKLEYEMFKDSPMYVQMFDDLDHASTRMLVNMKKRMEDLQGEWKNLDPTQLKEMQSRLNEIDAQLARRNPFSTLARAIRDYRKLLREGDERGNRSAKDADKDLIETARVAEEARRKYDELVKKYGKGSEESVQEVIDAKGKLDQAMANEEAAQKAVENWKKVKDMIGLSANELFQMLNWAGDIAHAVADISEAMGADEEDVQYWNDVADALGNIAGGIKDIVSAAMSGNVTGIISSTLTAIPKMFVGFANLFAAGKVKRANKEIKRQQELLEQLEYTYGRLEKAAERAFGGDYISNYNQRMRVLRAEQEAYLKQAEAERSKGKKEDEAKTQEYMNRARDAADQIAEMQSQIAEQMTGTDVGSAAREFAQAWLEAYASFSSTSSALKEKFDDMIKSMVVESVMAKVVSDAMQPMFDEMNEMYKRGESMTSVLAYAMKRSSELASELDAGLRTAAAEVEAAGVSIRGLYNGGDGLKGISRDIATASEESITGLAQGVNTQNYYLSHVPQLAQNVAAMRAMMEAAVVRGGVAGVSGVDYTGLSAEAMGHLAAIERHTAETVAECRNIAARCEEEVGLLRRVIVPKGQRGAHGVQVWM